MPMELLREIAQTKLPCTFTAEQDIDRLRVLRATGYVAALLPAPGSENQLGRVLAITAAGRKALRQEQAATSNPSAKKTLTASRTSI